MKKQWKCPDCKHFKLDFITRGGYRCGICDRLFSLYEVRSLMATKEWSPYPPESQKDTTNCDKTGLAAWLPTPEQTLDFWGLNNVPAAWTLFPVNGDDAAGALDNPYSDGRCIATGCHNSKAPGGVRCMECEDRAAASQLLDPVCECGAEKSGSGGHSHWCPKYQA